MSDLNVTENTTGIFGNSTGTENKSQGYVGMIIAMFALAVFLNLSALIMLIKSSKSHKWNPFYRLLLSLNITDLFGSLTCFPVLLATYANNVEWPGGQPLCDYTGFMISFVFMSSAALVGSMSLERFLGVWFPFNYNDMASKEKRANIVLGSIWVFTGTFALMPIIGFGEYVLQYPGTWCFYNFRAKLISSEIYAFLYSAIWLLIVLATVVFNILVVVKLVHRRCFVKKYPNNPGGMKTKSKKSDRNEIFSIVLLMVIVFTTTTCGVPLAIRAIVNEIGSEKDNKADLHASRMATFNMILDPLVYILFRKENLEKLFKLFRKSPDKGSRQANLASSSSNSEKSEPKSKESTQSTNMESRY